MSSPSSDRLLASNREKPVEVLAQARFFSGVSKARLERVAALGRGRFFPQDTRIYTVGDAVDDFYVLADGMVRFTLGLGKRETSAGDIIRRGDVFGWRRWWRGMLAASPPPIALPRAQSSPSTAPRSTDSWKATLAWAMP